MTKLLSIAVFAAAFSASIAGGPAHAISKVQPMARIAVAASGTQQAEAEGTRNGAVRDAKAEGHDFNEGRATDI
jgi:hypothetical protein